MSKILFSKLGFMSLLTGCLLVVACIWAPTAALKASSAIRGEWADQAVSDLLSRRYDARIRVSGVRMPSWTEIHFETIRVDSKSGERWIRSGKGHLLLREIIWSKRPVFVTELTLEELDLMQAYYQRALPMNPWGRLLKKPLRLDRVRLKITQSPEKTQVDVKECQAEGLDIEGIWQPGPRGSEKKSLNVKLSPWLVLKTAV